MRRLLDVVIVLAAIGVSVLWWRGFPVEVPPPAPEPEVAAASAAPVPVAATVVPGYEEGTAFPEDEEPEDAPDELPTWEKELRLQQERDRIEREEQNELSRRDAERREAFAKHKSLRNQRISEARDREERAQSAKASYEALRQHRRDCARTTKNGTYQAYGCEGINERVRKAETDMKNARNRR